MTQRIGMPSGRAVVGGLLMAVAAIGTFLAYAGAATDDAIGVLIAAHRLEPGEVIEPDDVRLVSVGLPPDVRGLFGDVDAAVGREVTATVEPGEFLLASATIVPTPGDETLEVAITVPVTRSVSGLRPGDRVDVFSTWSSDVTKLIAVDARVLAVNGSGGGVLNGETVTLRLALEDFAQVEALVHAQAAGDITVVRATLGTETVDVGREYRPRAPSGGDHG